MTRNPEEKKPSRRPARRAPATPRPRIQGLFNGMQQPDEKAPADPALPGEKDLAPLPDRERQRRPARIPGNSPSVYRRLPGEDVPAGWSQEEELSPKRQLSIREGPSSRSTPAATAVQPGGQEQVIPAVETIGPLVWQSLSSGRPAVNEGNQEQNSSTLAHARIIGSPVTGAAGGFSSPNTGALAEHWHTSESLASPLDHTDLQAVLLEIIDERPGRKWSEDELLLVEQVTDQLSLALENARLFEESRRRAEQLAMLNEMSRELSSQIDANQVIETVYSYTSRLLDTTNFYVALNLEERDEIVFPLYVDQNIRRQVKGRKRTNALTEYVIRTRQPLLIKENVLQVLRDRLGVEAQGTPSQCWLGVPLIYAGQVNGVVAVQSYTQSRLFDESHRDILVAVASQASVAIQNANLFQQAQRRSQELALVNQVVTSVSASLDLQNSLEIVTHALADAIRAFTGVALLESEPPVLRVVTNASPYPDTPFTVGLEIPLQDNPSSQRVIDTHQSLLIEEPQTDPLTLPIHEVLQQLDVRSLLIIPILSASQVIGTVAMEILGEERRFSPEEVRLAETIVYQAGTAIQNARLFAESQRRARQLQTAAEIARDTSGSLALDSLLPRAVALLCERFDYYHASVFLLDENETEAIVRESFGPTTGQAGEMLKRSGHRLEVGSASVIGQVTATGRTLLLNDISRPEARTVYRPNPLLPLTRAELGIPLRIGAHVIGVLDVQAAQVNAFTPDDVAVLETLADQIAVAVDNARAYELTQKAMEEIRVADRLKSQFLANMSHELRTPLNSIIGFSRVIIKGIDGPVNDQQIQDLTAIYNSGQHLLGLINDVLDVSKIEAGKMELAFEQNTNLGEMIRSVMSTTLGLVKDKPIQLKQVIAPDLPPVCIDPMKIRQVLINLLSNAAKFTESGTITVQAEPHSSPDRTPEVKVSITDSGPGIAPEDQVKLFQPFSQVDGSLTRKTGGSGLGLSICHHLIRMHGGRIGLQSEIGKGSTFFFILPVQPPAEPYSGLDQPILPDVVSQREPTGELVPTRSAGTRGSDLSPFTGAPAQPPGSQLPAKSEEPVETQTSVAQRLTGPAVLLAIDRDPQVINFYRRYLTSQDISVISLTELEQAVTVARGIQPLAITLDITMQGTVPGADGSPMDGWKLLESLKADPGTRHIPVIICTLATEQERARQLGAQEYLLKPVLEDDLAQAIQRVKNNENTNCEG